MLEHELKLTENTAKIYWKYFQNALKRLLKLLSILLKCFENMAGINRQ